MRTQKPKGGVPYILAIAAQVKQSIASTKQAKGHK